MPIMFNMILRGAGIAPDETILLRHKEDNAPEGRTPFEMWRTDQITDFEDYQSEQSVQNRSKFIRAQHWASFVGTPSGGTLFVGLFDCKGLKSNHSKSPVGGADHYILTRSVHLADLSRKLLIDWGGGPSGKRAWVQRAERKNKVVSEVRLKYEEDPFPGFKKFRENLSRLNHLPSSWHQVLRSFRGVYILTCEREQKHYVGSATGKEGFFQRWSSYARDGHGGNVKLMGRPWSDYLVSILEVAGSDDDDEKILTMESDWMRRLNSRKIGLNS